MCRSARGGLTSDRLITSLFGVSIWYGSFRLILVPGLAGSMAGWLRLDASFRCSQCQRVHRDSRTDDISTPSQPRRSAHLRNCQLAGELAVFAGRECETGSKLQHAISGTRKSKVRSTWRGGRGAAYKCDLSFCRRPSISISPAARHPLHH